MKLAFFFQHQPPFSRLLQFLARCTVAIFNRVIGITTDGENEQAACKKREKRKSSCKVKSWDRVAGKGLKIFGEGREGRGVARFFVTCCPETPDFSERKLAGK